MIKAVFFRNSHSDTVGFDITGHAGYAGYGKDIVCAAVSAMSMMAINTVEEVFLVKGDITSGESGSLHYIMGNSDDPKLYFGAHSTLKGFALQLEDLSKQYPGKISVTYAESE